MIVVNTIHTFVLLRDGNLIFWWPSVIQGGKGEGRQGVGERRGWKNGERWEEMGETGDKAKRKKGGEGRKESRERERRSGVGEDYHLSFPSLSFLPPPVSLHPFPLIYVVMIVVNTIHTFVLLWDGNLIFWWPSVIHV
jgi:hypothetical protein